MEFEQATERYLDRMCEITAQAKRQLHGLGLSQWQKGYPSREVWEQDIVDGCTHLALEDGAVAGVFAFKTEPEASYAVIDGCWLTSGRYASLHRVCVADELKGHGVAGVMLERACRMARDVGLPSMRIDTHPGNAPMRRVLDKAGFAYCGTIRLADGCEKGDERVTFEKVLEA